MRGTEEAEGAPLTGEICDHGLEVEEGLEATLGDLRLKIQTQERREGNRRGGCRKGEIRVDKEECSENGRREERGKERWMEREVDGEGGGWRGMAVAPGKGCMRCTIRGSQGP